MMGLGKEDRIFFNLYYFHGHGAVRLINKFLPMKWKRNTLNDFIKRFKQTGSISEKPVKHPQTF